jgi:alkylated DNA repair dioxygenase AlkB
MHWSLPDDAQLELWPDFVPLAERASLFTHLHAALPWQSRAIRIAGRDVLEPRLTAFIGDAEAGYTYSGRYNAPDAWPEALQALRIRVSEVAGAAFNCVLCNFYRDGRDSMGMHADNEAELGVRPSIASLSLGATRRFQLRHRKSPDARLDLDLVDGSLLVMRGDIQTHYRHGVPKQLAIHAPRINLTFRLVRH